MKKYVLIFCLLIAGFFGVAEKANAQELHQDVQGTVKAKITEITLDEIVQVPGTNVTTPHQLLKAEIIEGEEKGKIIEIENDFYQAKKGQVYFVNFIRTIEGQEIYRLGEPDRITGIYIIIAIFIGVVLFFGRSQGLRSLFSLAVGFSLIIGFLLPQLLKGGSPVFLSIVTAIIILAFAIFSTHGFNKVTIAAFLGTSVSSAITGIFAFLAVKGLILTGYTSDETTYLNIATSGELSISGLLLGAIIIGALGVLDDIAITQASVVRELKLAAPHMTDKAIFKSALRVGREHVGALINTLALAYVGASLPLLLLFYGTSAPFAEILNREVFATEIVRTIAGSIGLILAVPITTWLSTYLFRSKAFSKVSDTEVHAHHHH